MSRREISFFPFPAPDETLYSVCSRFHHRSGNRHWSDTGNTLFGIPRSGQYIHVPMGLNHFTGLLEPDYSDLSHTLLEYTVAPLFLAILDRPAKEKFIEIRSLQSVDAPFLNLGMPGNPALTPNILKYCYYCSCEDEETLGFTYWHRIHQFPGIWICEKHNAPLTPIRTYNRGEPGWIRCPQRDELDANSSAIISLSGKTRLLHLARSIRWVTEQSFVLESEINNAVMIRLEQLCQSNDKRVFTRMLVALSTNFYSQLPSDFPSPDLNELKRTGWLFSFTSRTRGLHPIQWAFLLALCYSIEELESLKVSLATNGSKQKDLFEESTIYPTRHTDIEDSIRKMAHCGLDISTLSRNLGIHREVAKNLILQSEFLENTWSSAKRARRKMVLRILVLDYAVSHPGTTLRQLFEKFPTEAKWLLRNDAEWFKNVTTSGAIFYQQLPLL